MPEYTMQTGFVHEIPELVKAKNFEELIEKGRENLREKGIDPSTVKFDNCIGIIKEDTSFIPFDEKLYEMLKVKLGSEEEKSYLEVFCCDGEACGVRRIPVKNILHSEVMYMMKVDKALRHFARNSGSLISLFPELLETTELAECLGEYMETEIPVRRKVEDIMFESQNVDLGSIDARRISERIGTEEPMFYEKIHGGTGASYEEWRDGPHLKTKERKILGKKKEIDEETLKTLGVEKNNLFFREPSIPPLGVLFPYEIFSEDSEVGLEVKGILDYQDKKYVLGLLYQLYIKDPGKIFEIYRELSEKEDKIQPYEGKGKETVKAIFEKYGISPKNIEVCKEPVNEIIYPGSVKYYGYPWYVTERHFF